MTRLPPERATAIELALLKSFREQEQVFSEAAGFLGRLLDEVATAPSISASSMDDLQRWLRRIADAQSTAGKTREQFESAGAALTPAGRREIAQRETALREFQSKVDEVLLALQSCRSELVPHLDSDVRRRSMHSAYQASLRTC